MLLPVLLYGSETIFWNKKYRSKVQCVQMDNLRSMLGVRRINKMRNERIRELCGGKKGVNERINESMLKWFGHVERRAKRKWIESGKECLKERNVRLAEARIKVHDRTEWRGFVWGHGCG